MSEFWKERIKEGIVLILLGITLYASVLYLAAGR